MVSISFPKNIHQLHVFLLFFSKKVFRNKDCFFPFQFQQKFAVYAQLNARNINSCINKNKGKGNSYKATKPKGFLKLK